MWFRSLFDSFWMYLHFTAPVLSRVHRGGLRRDVDVDLQTNVQCNPTGPVPAKSLTYKGQLANAPAEYHLPQCRLVLLH